MEVLCSQTKDGGFNFPLGEAHYVHTVCDSELRVYAVEGIGKLTDEFPV